MIFLAQRLNSQETDADKQEFVRGVTGLDPKNGKRQFATGIIAGYLLSKALKKNG
jgi:hypothetical protein